MERYTRAKQRERSAQTLVLARTKSHYSERKNWRLPQTANRSQADKQRWSCICEFKKLITMCIKFPSALPGKMTIEAIRPDLSVWGAAKEQTGISIASQIMRYEM
jgi:hypothetical protein